MNENYTKKNINFYLENSNEFIPRIDFHCTRNQLCNFHSFQKCIEIDAYTNEIFIN